MNINEFFNWIKALSRKPKELAYYAKIETKNKNCLTITPKEKLINCGNTAEGLWEAIHYDDATAYPVLNGLSLFSIYLFNNVRKILEHPDSTLLYTYEINFQGYIVNTREHPPMADIFDHGWIIIQYKSDNNEIRFRFFQSYLAGYSLEEYLESSENQHNSNDFSQDEFITFTEQLVKFSKATSWTNDIERFYQEYFKIKTSHDPDDTIYNQFFSDYDTGSIENTPAPLQFSVRLREKKLNMPLETWLASRAHISQEADKLYICPRFDKVHILFAITKLIKAAKHHEESTDPTLMLTLFDMAAGGSKTIKIPAHYTPLLEALKRADDLPKQTAKPALLG